MNKMKNKTYLRIRDRPFIDHMSSVVVDGKRYHIKYKGYNREDATNLAEKTIHGFSLESLSRGLEVKMVAK